MGFSTKLLKQMKTFQDDERNESDRAALVLVTLHPTHLWALLVPDGPPQPPIMLVLLLFIFARHARVLLSRLSSLVLIAILSLRGETNSHIYLSIPILLGFSTGLIFLLTIGSVFQTFLCTLLQTFGVTIFFIICHSHL